MWHSRILLATLFLLGAAVVVAHGDEQKARPTLDFAYYEMHVAPLVEAHCAECHANPQRKLGRHRLKPPLGSPVRAKHHKQNFRTISKLIKPGRAKRSPWILKPLGPHQGGLEHGGGQRIVRGGPGHQVMLAFVNGARLDTTPPEVATRPAPPPVVALAPDEATTLPPSAFGCIGAVLCDAGEDGTPRLHAEAGGGTATVRITTPEPRLCLLTLLVRGPGTGLGWRLDDAPWSAFDPVAEGEHRIGVDLLSDGEGPVVTPTGALSIEGESLLMEATAEKPAAWIASTAHDATRLEARFRRPTGPWESRDALLVFGRRSVGEGAFVGLTAGGAWLSAGRIVAGRPVVTASARVDEFGEAGATAHLGVAHVEDGVVVTLGKEERLFLRLPDASLTGRFGVRTGGRIVVDDLRAWGPGEDGQEALLYRSRFASRPAVLVPAGRHDIHIALPRTAPAVLDLRLEPFPIAEATGR